MKEAAFIGSGGPVATIGFTYPPESCVDIVSPPVPGWTNVARHERTDVRSSASFYSAEYPQMEGDSNVEHVPARAGRAVSTTVEFRGAGVQVGVISTRGNLIDSASLDLTQVDALIGALQRARAQAFEAHHREDLRRRQDAKKSYAEVLARNPWQNGENDKLATERYIERPR